MSSQHSRIQQPNAKVLIISDELSTAEVWGFSLNIVGLNVTLIGIADPILETWIELAPDLIIIEDFNKDVEEIELCRQLRKETAVPILFLTGKTEESFQLQVYEVGADECITFPITPRLFQAKVKAWLRRTMSVPLAVLNEVETGELRLNVAKRVLSLPEGDQVKLTNLESRLLYLLMSHPGRGFETEEIVNRVWGYWGEGDGTLLKNLVYRLRRKIEPNPTQPRFIITVEGRGYGFQDWGS
jgi:two-component system response regulator RegX3